jgi:hypothetical protein
VTSAAINTTGATLIVIATSDYGINGCTYPDTITDSKSNTWTCAGTYSSDASVDHATIWYSIPTSVGSGHTFTVSGSLDSFAVAAFAGTAISSVVDAVTGAGGSSSTLQPGSLTPGADNELLIAVGAVYGVNVSSVDSPFSSNLVQNVAGGPVNEAVALAYEIQTTATARNPTWTFSGSQYPATILVAFKAASGPPPCCSGVTSGNWHNPVTWGFSAGTCSSGVTCPSDSGGNTVAIGNGTTVTCETGQTCTVGTSPASDGTPRALACTTGYSGTGVLVVNGTLVYKGSVESCAADWTISAGATVRYDDSASGGAAYYGWHMHTGRLLLSGTSGSHVTWTTVNGAQTGLIGSDSSGTGEGQVLASYTDFSHVGNTIAFQMSYPGSTGSWTMDFSDCTFCSVSYIGTTATSVMHVKNSTLNNSLYIGGSAVLTTGERTIANSAVGGIVPDVVAGASLTLQNVVLTGVSPTPAFRAHYTGGSIGSWDSVLLVDGNTSSSTLPSGTLMNTYAFTWSNSVSDRVHASYVLSYAEPTILDTWVWESTSNDTGNALTQPGPDATYPMEYLGQLVLPSPSGETGGILAVDTSGTTATKTFYLQHNTAVLSGGDSNGAGATAEANGAVPTTWPAGTLAAFLNNLFWRTSSLAGAAALYLGTTGTINDGALTGVDYNWYFNIPTSASLYTYSGTTVAKYASPSPPGPHDTHIASAPPFVDATRRLLLYDQQALGASVATAWSGSHGTYNVGDLVSDSASGQYGGVAINWSCTTAHTAASAQEPMVGSGWMSYWEPAALATIRAQVVAGQTGVQWLIDWVRRGFTVTNPKLWCAASDGDTPGAVKFCGLGKALLAAVQ